MPGSEAPLHGGTLHDREDLTMAPEARATTPGSRPPSALWASRDEDKRPLVLPMGQCLNLLTVLEWAAAGQASPESRTFLRKLHRTAQFDCAPAGTLHACLIVGRYGTPDWLAARAASAMSFICSTLPGPPEVWAATRPLPEQRLVLG
jgi:hypothetical protein